MTQAPLSFEAGPTDASEQGAPGQKTTKHVMIGHTPTEVPATHHEVPLPTGKILKVKIVDSDDVNKSASATPSVPPSNVRELRRRPDVEDCPNQRCTGVCASCGE